MREFYNDIWFITTVFFAVFSVGLVVALWRRKRVRNKKPYYERGKVWGWSIGICLALICALGFTVSMTPPASVVVVRVIGFAVAGSVLWIGSMQMGLLVGMIASISKEYAHHKEHQGQSTPTQARKRNDTEGR